MPELSMTIEGEYGETLTHAELIAAIKEKLDVAGVVEYRILNITPIIDATVVQVEINSYKEKGKPKLAETQEEKEKYPDWRDDELI